MAELNVAKRRLAVLVSGRGSNLQALIDATAEPGFPAEIALVLSNVPGAFGLTRAERVGIPTRVLSHKDYAGRIAFETALTAILEEAGIELVCLAGFMRLLTDGFVEHWRDRLINIHPSLLPSFKGLHTHERALAAGVRFTGCTVHFVRADMDAGPIIAQAAVPVLDGDDADCLAERVLRAEHRIYPLAVRLVSLGLAMVVKDAAGLEVVRLEGVNQPADFLINPDVA